MSQILQLWDSVKAAGQSAVLATVVKTQGSSYRLPGAHLLLTQNGAKAGSVSGGCLEDDLIKKSWWLTENGPAVRRYDTTPDGEIAAEYGLGCNGIIHVLLERVTPAHSQVLDLHAAVRSQRCAAAIAHVFAPAAASKQKLTIDTTGNITHNIANVVLAENIESEARATLAGGQSRSFLFEELEVFIETLAPPTRLLVFGAGDDAIPLSAMAGFLGWQVFVLDGRSHYARRSKFPAADRVIVLEPEQADVSSYIDPWTVAVLMTHSYSQDFDNLRRLASQPLRYLGILGPRKRSAQLLADAGMASDALNEALHGPMGLDIGADGPEQVALSVIAEIQAALNGRHGGSLARRNGSIHSRDAQSGEGAHNSGKFQVRSIVCA